MEQLTNEMRRNKSRLADAGTKKLGTNESKSKGRKLFARRELTEK